VDRIAGQRTADGCQTPAETKVNLTSLRPQAGASCRLEVSRDWFESTGIASLLPSRATIIDKTGSPQSAYKPNRPISHHAINTSPRLKKLRVQAFDRADWAQPAIRRCHAVTARLDAATVQNLRGFYDWMFVPTTLWPFNIQDVLEDCLSALEKNKCKRRLKTGHEWALQNQPH